MSRILTDSTYKVMFLFQYMARVISCIISALMYFYIILTLKIKESKLIYRK